MARTAVAVLVAGTMMFMAAGTLPGQESRPGNRRCAPLTVPKKLPSADTIVDSAALAASLPADGEGVFLFSVGGGPGRSRAARPIEDQGARISDTMTALVAAALRANPDAVGDAIRLRITTGPQPAFSIEKSVLCPPTAPPSTAVGRISTTTTTRLPDRVRSPKFRLRISVEGAVVETLLRSSSGVPELDRELMAVVSRNRFQPALLDGMPVEVWLDDGRVEIVR